MGAIAAILLNVVGLGVIAFLKEMVNTMFKVTIGSISNLSGIIFGIPKFGIG